MTTTEGTLLGGRGAISPANDGPSHGNRAGPAGRRGSPRGRAAASWKPAPVPGPPCSACSPAYPACAASGSSAIRPWQRWQRQTLTRTASVPNCRPATSAACRPVPGSTTPSPIRHGTMSLPPRRLIPAATRPGAACPDLLTVWVSALAASLYPGGDLTLAVPASAIPAALAALAAGGCGSPVIMPLWPRAGQPARLALVRGTRSGRAGCRLLAGLTLHVGADYSAAARAVLWDGGRIGLGKLKVHRTSILRIGMPELPQPFMRCHETFHVSATSTGGGHRSPRQHHLQGRQQLLGDFEVVDVTGVMEGHEYLVGQPAPLPLDHCRNAGIPNRLVSQVRQCPSLFSAAPAVDAATLAATQGRDPEHRLNPYVTGVSQPARKRNGVNVSSPSITWQSTGYRGGDSCQLQLATPVANPGRGHKQSIRNAKSSKHTICAQYDRPHRLRRLEHGL